LVDRTAILEASQHHQISRHEQLTTALKSESRQVARLPELTGIQQERYDHAGILIHKVSESLISIESQAIIQMEQYENVLQLAKWNHWKASTLDWFLKNRQGGYHYSQRPTATRSLSTGETPPQVFYMNSVYQDCRKVTGRRWRRYCPKQVPSFSEKIWLINWNP
jgi:hypothetical protein